MNLTLAVVTKTEPTDKAVDAWALEKLGIAALDERYHRPVFEVGEILLLDGSGREVAGHRRKPDKWSVTVEYFSLDHVDAAIARAHEVME